MLRAQQILELKHHATPKQRMIYEAFKAKIKNDPQGNHILGCFGITTINIFPLMEVYVSDILSSKEFNYMIATFNNISNACIQAFIDGMTLDDAIWARSITQGCLSTLEKIFTLITRGYSKEQIEAFAKEHYNLEQREDNLGWFTSNLYDVVLGYPNISVEEIECCAKLIIIRRVICGNKDLFITLLKTEVDTSELSSFFYAVDTWDYNDQEIIEAFMDFKMLQGKEQN